MIRAYKYKMKPTASQQAFLNDCFGCCRFVYNHALAERIEAYKSSKKSLTFFDQCKALTKMKKQEGFTWLNNIPALSLNYALLNLNNAYTRFFKTKSGFPKFKSKKRSGDSVKFEPNSTKYDFINNKVRLPKLGWVKLCKGRTFDPSAVKQNSTTVSRDACGTYWCTVSLEDGTLPEPKAKVREETAVGLDVGIRDFATLSDGTKIPNLRFSETQEKKIAGMQRCIARKQRGTKDKPASNRYLRFTRKLAVAHRRIENRRTDHLQQVSTTLIRQYKTICIEDLNVKGMMANHSLAGAIGSASWSRFVSMLEYKGEWYGVNVLKAGRFDPTSQTCSACGWKNTDMKDLSVREWTCPQCGARHDRDVNAAANIKEAAIKKYFNQQSPAVTGITDADGADRENKMGMQSSICDYASDETSMNFQP